MFLLVVTNWSFFIGCHEFLFHWLLLWNSFSLTVMSSFFDCHYLEWVPFNCHSWVPFKVPVINSFFRLAVMNLLIFVGCHGLFLLASVEFFYRLLWVSFLWAVLNSSFFGPLPGLRNFFLTIHLHLLCLVYCSWQARVFPDKIVLIILKSIPNFVLLFIFF